MNIAIHVLKFHCADLLPAIHNESVLPKTPFLPLVNFALY